MTENYVEHAKVFIALFHTYMFSCKTPHDYSRALRNFQRTHPEYMRMRISNGITRVALIGTDFVVKINFDDYEIETFGGCEEEIAFYEVAKSEGMAHLFAPIMRFRYCGKTFYIMPHIHDIDECRDEDATAYMTDEERDWCNEHELHDLHSGNYGFVDEQVTIIDYACYGRD